MKMAVGQMVELWRSIETVERNPTGGDGEGLLRFRLALIKREIKGVLVEWEKVRDDNKREVGIMPDQLEQIQDVTERARAIRNGQRELSARMREYDLQEVEVNIDQVELPQGWNPPAGVVDGLLPVVAVR